jgi:hypothetical protein
VDNLEVYKSDYFSTNKIQATWKEEILFVETRVATELAVYTDTASWNSISQEFFGL